MTRRLAQKLLLIAAFLLFSPRYVLAQGWLNWGTQGSYVHQLAHFLFFVAMVFFIVALRRENISHYRGFRSLIWGCVFLAFWNLDAIVGHAVEWTLINPVILGHGWSQRLLMENEQTWVYYVTQNDHFLLLIPAFYLYYRGLKILGREFETEQQ